MTRLHRCQPYDVTYTARGARCEACGRTWWLGPYRYSVTNPGTPPDAPEPNLSDRRKAATYE